MARTLVRERTAPSRDPRLPVAVWWIVMTVPTAGLLTPVALLDVAGRRVGTRTLAGAGLSALAVVAGLVLVVAGAGVPGAALLALNLVGGLAALAAALGRREG